MRIDSGGRLSSLLFDVGLQFSDLPFKSGTSFIKFELREEAEFVDPVSQFAALGA